MELTVFSTELVARESSKPTKMNFSFLLIGLVALVYQACSLQPPVIDKSVINKWFHDDADIQLLSSNRVRSRHVSEPSHDEDEFKTISIDTDQQAEVVECVQKQYPLRWDIFVDLDLLLDRSTSCLVKALTNKNVKWVATTGQHDEMTEGKYAPYKLTYSIGEDENDVIETHKRIDLASAFNGMDIWILNGLGSEITMSPSYLMRTKQVTKTSVGNGYVMSGGFKIGGKITELLGLKFGASTTWTKGNKTTEVKSITTNDETSTGNTIKVKPHKAKKFSLRMQTEELVQRVYTPLKMSGYLAVKLDSAYEGSDLWFLKATELAKVFPEFQTDEDFSEEEVFVYITSLKNRIILTSMERNLDVYMRV